MNVKYCPKCPLFSYQLTRVITHIGLVHSGEPNFSIFCGIEGCANTYRNFSSYRSHLYRRHTAVLEENGSDCHQRSFVRPSLGSSAELPSSEQFLQEMDSADMATTDSGNLQEEASAEDLPSQQRAAPDNHFERFLQQAKSTIWDFFFSVTTQHSIAYVAAEKIFTELKVVFELVLKAYGEELVKTMRAPAMGPELQSLLHCSFLPELFDGIDSKWKREKYIVENFPFVPPEEHYVGQAAKYHYVPLPKLLTALCQLPDVAAHLTLPNIERHAPSVYRDYTDGLVYRDYLQSVIPEGSTHSIILLFYTDEIEMANPLGAKRGKHKILAVYCGLVNLHTKYRSQLDNIYLIMLVRYVPVKIHGLGSILRPLLEDLKKMHKEGLTLSVEGHDISARVVVFAFCGDNLSLNRLGGFSCCFSNGRVCRYCMVSAKHLAEKTTEIMCQARTFDRHKLHLAAVAVNIANRRLYGVNEASPLLQLPYFDVTRQLPPDIMHDILEGGAECVLRQVLKSLQSCKLLSKQDLDEVSSFEYGQNDAKNKPPPINISFLKANSVLAGTASSKWCLFRFFPLIFGARVPEGNEDWEVLLKFQEIIDIIFASEIESSRLAYLDILVQSVLVEFVEQYGPEVLIPKLHYMVHYARFVREVGPLKNFWSMRFEAKHQSFKRMAATVKNFRNLKHTLAQRHQIKQSCQLHTFRLYQELETAGSKPIQWSTLPTCAKEVLRMTVHEVKNAMVDRRTYKAGSVLVMKTEDGPEFYEIERLLVARGVLYTLTRTLVVEYFDRHRYCYCTRRSDEQKIQEASERFEPYLLDIYGSGELVPKWETW